MLALDWAVWIPTVLLVALVLVCFLGPVVFGLPAPNVTDLLHPRAGLGTSGHLLGTDELGRDLLSRALHGGQVSIEIGLGSVAIGMALGGLLGMVSGFTGGWVESLIMRVLDTFLAFPSLILALTVAAYLGPSEGNVILAIAFFTVPTFGRIARAGTLQIRQRDFVLSGVLAGARSWYLIIRHVLPNILGGLMTYGLLTVGVAMIVEASLSFLGLGVRPPQPSWGGMISEGKGYLSDAPQIAFVPGAFLFLFVALLNLLGERLRSRHAVGGER
ncbi:MAG: ABC transporter permease [Actinomycetota bacterium]|nr:ABC transporter permease [Actinomycetota bacterium]